jgi:hypothetical protein
MDNHHLLLARMASISPGARLHLEGKLFLEHIDADEIDSQQLVNEVFTVIIDEAYELGIEFHCTLSDLCESFYDLDTVLLLFEVVFPTPLYRSITEDAGFKTVISALVLDGAGDPHETTVMAILTYLARDHRDTQAIFTDTHRFLEDKMTSTPVFDTYVRSILDADNTPFDAPVDVATVTAYIAHIADKVFRLLKAIDVVRLKRRADASGFQIHYNRLDIYKVNATDAAAAPRYAWVYQIRQSPMITPVEQALTVSIVTDFKSTTPFFEEYFTIRQAPLLIEDVISLVLGCFAESFTKESFTSDVDAVFQRLTKETPLSHDLHLVMQKTVLVLIEEFYP